MGILIPGMKFDFMDKKLAGKSDILAGNLASWLGTLVSLI
jgi:hypothetical protein